MRQYIDTLQDVNGNALVGATVLVQNYSNGTNASIYSDNGLTPITTSTVVTGSDGQFSFFAADGDYNLVMSKNSTVFKTQSPVTLFDGAAQLTFADTGTANAYSTSNVAQEKALRAGLRSSFQAANTNTGASTYAYNGLPAKNILMPGGAALPASTIIANGIYQVEYDGTEWQLRFVAGTATYVQTATEAANSIVPVNLSVPSNVVIGGGNVLRYQTNTTPGTTDMSTGFANAALGNGASTGGVFTIPPGSYLTNTALTGTYGYLAQGNPSFSGSNPIGAWIPTFGGAFQVVQTGTYNAFVGAAYNNLPSNSVAEPTGVTGYGRVLNSGNLVFGLFGRADLYAATGCATNEVDSFNWSGVAATGNLPPNRGFATSENVTVAWTVAAGGNAVNSIGVQICPEGSNASQFKVGQYINWNTCTQYGYFIDALLNDTCQPAVLKHSSNQLGVNVQGVGTIYGVAITGTAGQFSCSNTVLTNGAQVTVAGTLTGTGSITGYSNPTTYQISATNGTNTFTLQTLSGSALTTTAGTTTGLSFTSILPTGAGYVYTDANAAIQFKVNQFGQVNANLGKSVPAGGLSTIGYTITSTANLGIFVGSGVPTLSAAQGSIYLRTDGSSTSTRLYVNTNGTTGWTNLTSAT